MSNLSFMEKLLDGVEVEWKYLGSVTAIKTGQSVNKQMISNNPGEYPVINSGRDPLGYIDEWNTENDPIGITTRGAGVGSITWQEGRYFRGNLNYSVTIKNKQNLSTRYLYHLLLQMQKEIQDLCTFDGIPALNAGNLKDLQIPIPCPDNPKKSLEIQAEIVRILDAFTAMTAELTAELNLREKQYNYYRDQLLSFEEGEVEWKTLGEVATITIGEFVHKDKQDVNAKYPVYNGGRTATGYYDKYNNTGNKIIVSARGANAGFVNRLSSPYWAGNSCYSIGVVNEDSLNWNFVYYYLKQSEAKLIGIQQKGGIPAVSKKQMEEFLLPIPQLSEQERIVAILDKFDALTNSISEGLPREIELRQKQYEYYRDLLLSFPKPSDEVAA